MLRRFNYTGRRRIPRSVVSVKIYRDANSQPSFDIKFDISAFNLPGHAKVFVEAYHRASYMRFDYGHVSDIHPPRDRRLAEIESGGTTQFRVKVVDTTSELGCVLAEADGITPLDRNEAQTNRDSILPVLVTDLNDQVWRVDFDSPDGRPVLELNQKIEGVAQLALRDDRFFALTYPAVLREILGRVLFVEEFGDLDGPADDWRVQWLKFQLRFAGSLSASI